jgi:hypothetical protein
MSESRDLIGIYGAIDEADDEQRSAAGRMVRTFGDPDLRWFGALVRWAEEQRSDHSEPPFPGLVEALRSMQQRPPRGRMRARRLYALATATQAFPELTDPGTELGDAAVGMLIGSELAEDPEQAQELLRLLRGGGRSEDELPDSETLDAWWEEVAERLSEGGFIRDARVLGPRPCVGALVKVQLPEYSTWAATITAGFETDVVPFDAAVGFLDPVNWPGCNDFWCEMSHLGSTPPNTEHYAEVVSTDCANRASGWTIRAELDFWFDRQPGLLRAEYDLSAGHPRAGDDVLVDEGWLSLRELPDKSIRVDTTKRILFSRSEPSAEALATIMCLIGYGSVVEDLVFSCALEGGTPLKSPKATAPSHPPYENSLVDELADRAATSVKRCVDRGAEKAKASRSRILERSYDADALARDAADLSLHVVRESLDLARTSVGSGRAAATRLRARHRELRRSP